MIPAYLAIKELREYWLALRIAKDSVPLLVDYRTLQNLAHRLIKQEPKQ